jgi:large subunit ribosomal protein L10
MGASPPEEVHNMPTKADASSAQIQRKAAVIDEIKTRLTEADAAVLTEYRGLTVSEIANLRASLRPAATDYKIYKNTLARRAAEEAGLSDIVEQLLGPVAIAFVRKDGGDAVTAAKALRDFARTNPNLVVKGGVLASRMLSPSEIEALADVPPREQLLARLAGGFQAPLTKAAGLFQAFTRNFAYGLKAYVDQRVEGGEAAPAAEPEPAEAASAAEASEESRPGTPAPAGPDGGESDRSSEEAAPESTNENAPTAEAAAETVQDAANEATEESGE